MKLSSRNEVRRCRPLLGTFVEITAGGPAGVDLTEAIEAGFRAVARVHRLMNVHEETSELSQVNARAVEDSIQVSAATFEVLRCALDLARETEGAFDPTVAPVLARWGYLPARLCRQDAGNWRDVVLGPRRTVRLLRPLAIDLGGVAKGYAVDLAIEALRTVGATRGLVNAGGDLRVFGRRESRVHLRHPLSACPTAAPLLLRNTALATSSPCFTRRRWRGKIVSHLVDPAGRTAVAGAISVSVQAPQCWLADALTKVVLNAGAAVAERCLKAHAAEARILAA